jgi:hypothetical protein
MKNPKIMMVFFFLGLRRKQGGIIIAMVNATAVMRPVTIIPM